MWGSIVEEKTITIDNHAVILAHQVKKGKIMNNKNDEIRNLIAREFDTRMEAAVFSYILDKGISNLSEITDDEINELEENGLMTANFVQALVRTAVKICNTYTPMEIMEYVRVRCNFAPFPTSVTLYKENFTEDNWYELCRELDAEEEEADIQILVIKQ